MDNLFAYEYADTSSHHLPDDSFFTSQPDSSFINWSTNTEYDILRLRVQRWLLKNQQDKAASTFKSINDLLTDAEFFAQDMDYETAQLLLTSALALIDDREVPSEIPPIVLEQNSKNGIILSASKPLQEKWDWTREVLTGVDLSRLDFGIGFDQREVESSGNPYGGLRLGVVKRAGGTSVFRANALVKTSRDYYSGNLESDLKQSIGEKASLRLENQLETTSYHRDLDLQYWQNTNSFLLAFDVQKDIQLEVEDEIRFRHYRNESHFYPNYYQNEFSLAAVYSSRLSSRIQARYHFINRSHSSFNDNDFNEHRIEASLSQNLSSNSSIFIENIWRQRLYSSGRPDTTFQQPYSEEFAHADMRVGLSANTAFQLEWDLTFRQYQISNNLTPDFLYSRLNPKFEFKLFSDWQLSVGYIFLLRLHKMRENQNNLTNAATDDNASALLGFEDYLSNGFTLGIDFFNTSGFLFSASYAFTVRTYPNAASPNIDEFSLYSDRNINSLLLFMSWDVTPDIQLGAIANIDAENSRSDDFSDSKTTLFSVDLGYSF